MGSESISVQYINSSGVCFGRSENNGLRHQPTMAMVIFKTYKMADKGEERVLTKILVYSCFIKPFICLFVTMNWEVP